MTAAQRRKTSDAAGMAFEIKRKRHKQGDTFMRTAGMEKEKTNSPLANRQAGNNCLNLIRILAAFQVMLGHIIEHIGLSGNAAFLQWIRFPSGVPIFFVISGFLMWFSVGRSRTYGQFLKKRFWRIYPELWGAVIVEIIVLLLLYHDWDIKSLLLFAFGQASVFQFWTPGSLRGYGVGTPNGALWTIGVMIQFYLVVWFFYRLMKNRKMAVWMIVLAVSFAVSWAGDFITHRAAQNPVIGKLYGQTFIRYFWLFCFGMLIAEFKDRLLPVLRKYWYVSLIVAYLFFRTEWDLFSGYYLGWSLFLTAGALGFAYRFPRLSIQPDISYGLFLYHMTIVNLFVCFGWVGNWICAIPIAAISILLAYLSTVTAGRISAGRRRKISLTAQDG